MKMAGIDSTQLITQTGVIIAKYEERLPIINDIITFILSYPIDQNIINLVNTNTLSRFPVNQITRVLSYWLYLYDNVYIIGKDPRVLYNSYLDGMNEVRYALMNIEDMIIFLLRQSDDYLNHLYNMSANFLTTELAMTLNTIIYQHDMESAIHILQSFMGG